MSAGVLRLVPADGGEPRSVPFGPGELPEALRVQALYEREQSVRQGRRRVEVVVEDGDVR
ncbi:hypothetical protein [Micromonospora profundi]|uniref:hypothetical protein n=1 Tax=Micromonospora profundi TaxID=1420889 RepID=UPI003663B00B